jgi:hypothetical protein
MTGIDRLLSWFPATWKARYGTEVSDLLHSQPVTRLVYRDLLFALVDAWTREVRAAAFRLWPTVWELTVVAVVVASIAGVGWMFATEVRLASVQLGFASWLQSQVGPTVSGWLSGSRDILWIATAWIVLGWGWKLTPRIPRWKAIVSVLVTFSALLALDQNGPNFVDGLSFGAYLCSPINPRLQIFIRWMTGLLTSAPTDSVQQ